MGILETLSGVFESIRVDAFVFLGRPIDGAAEAVEHGHGVVNDA